MKLTNFKIVPFILAGTAFLALSGCDGTTGTASDSALTGVAPVAVNDADVGVSGAAATISVVANDTDFENNLDVSSVQIIGTANPGDSLVVTGEGTWTVSATGSVTFTPASGFTNDPTVIEYIVFDAGGLSSNIATVTIDYPQTAPIANEDDTNETILGTAVTLNVVENDTDAEGDINASTVNFVDIDATNTDSDNDNDHLIIAGEGNWTVDEDGNVTFTPETGFTNDPTPVFYTISDNTGLESNEANITIDYPEVMEQTFTNNIPVPIPEAGGTLGPTTSVITAVGATTSITKVTVTLDITHTWDADLDISLISPLGTTIILSNDNGGGGDDYNNTTFDDDALTPISGGIAPFTGSYMPEEPLATFDGEDANGIWTLDIVDDFTIDAGTLNSWSITIE